MAKTFFLIALMAFMTIQSNSNTIDYSFRKQKNRAVDSSFDGSLLIYQYQGIKKSRCLTQCGSNLNCSISTFQSNSKTCKMYYQSAVNYLINNSLSTSYFIIRPPLATTTTTTTVQAITNSLTNYWPIINSSLSDQAGSSSVSTTSSISYVSNRLAVSNDAVFINNGYMRIPAGTYFSSTFTLMMWVNMIQFPSAPTTLFDCGGGSYASDDILLAIDQNGYLFSEVWKAITVSGKANVSNALNLNTWVHLAFTWDASIAQIYINGVLGSSTTLVTANGIHGVSRTRCGFGLAYSSNTATLSAYMDEMRIYSRCLSSLEVYTQYLVSL